jgi:hypothetical protein
MNPRDLQHFSEQLDADIAQRGTAAPKQPLQALDAHQLALMQFKVREVILDPWLHSQDLCMVFSARGIGKTHFGLSIAYAVSTAGTFAKWRAPTARKVLYLDGELPGSVMQKRLLMHCPDVEPQPGYLRIFTPDLLPEGHALPDLATYAGQEELDAMIEDAEVVFVDNLSAWARTGRENEAESWLPVADWILSLRRRGIAVVLVHHAGKGGQGKRKAVLSLASFDAFATPLQLQRWSDIHLRRRLGSLWECEAGSQTQPLDESITSTSVVALSEMDYILNYGELAA